MPSYVLSWDAPNEHLFDVTVRFTAPTDGPRLVLPNWRPGRYLIQNFAANVRQWNAAGADGSPLPIAKDGKASWIVEAGAGEEVTVRYRYFAGVLDAGSSYLDEDEAYFNGSNLFMLVDGLRQEAHRLTIAAPADWRIETQLPGERNTREARDYDHLIDSPTVCAATMTRYSFEESGARFHLIFRDDQGIDTVQFLEPMKKMIRAQAELFGGLPFEEYRFLYHVRDRWHGVEHESSCSVIAKRSDLLGVRGDGDGWDHFLSISSHELFHAWMVKRMLPALFRPYDYSVETPTRLLWVMEGMTSYYGDLLLLRAGVWTFEHYLQRIAREIEVLESSAGREHLSLAQASFDGWLHEQLHDRANGLVSFYNKGELVSLALDLTIRHQSNGAFSLDDVLRRLWREYGVGGRGMEEDALERAVAAVTALDLGDFFAAYVHGTEPLPYAEVLGRLGVEVVLKPRGERSLGLRLRAGVVVDAVFRGGAAMAAGLLPGDELLAVDSFRVTSEQEVARVLRASEGSVTVLTARNGVVETRSVTPRPDPRRDAELKAGEETELRRAWLTTRAEGVVHE